MPLTLSQKLEILADAAKYDASCASSGGPQRSSAGTKALGSTGGCGICHAYAPDGRCISLLKILLTNFCVFDCLYCVNRTSSNVRRARFSVEEVVDLTLDFYKRNYIEGLFLSSGIVRSSDHTMGELVRVARSLREEHDFRGYIHLKTIPDADPALLAEAGRYADRLSINVELPRESGLKRLAPQKDAGSIRRAMAGMRLRIEEAEDARRTSQKAPLFAPAGQSTQMIVGADGESDRDILETSGRLYSGYRLKRVYYSAFSPIPQSAAALPLEAPPLVREHRLYQADWLTRYYGFSGEEILAHRPDGMLDLKHDPKLAWALANRSIFPVDVNRADRWTLLRVPGLGVRVVDRILAARRWRRLDLAALARIVQSLSRIRPFVAAEGWHPGSLLDRSGLSARLTPARQLELFS